MCECSHMTIIYANVISLIDMSLWMNTTTLCENIILATCCDLIFIVVLYWNKSGYSSHSGSDYNGQIWHHKLKEKWHE